MTNKELTHTDKLKAVQAEIVKRVPGVLPDIRDLKFGDNLIIYNRKAKYIGSEKGTWVYVRYENGEIKRWNTIYKDDLSCNDITLADFMMALDKRDDVNILIDIQGFFYIVHLKKNVIQKQDIYWNLSQNALHLQSVDLINWAWETLCK